MQRTEPLPDRPWVIVGPAGVFWLGHANSEAQAWTVALGWPTSQEIDRCRCDGYYAAEATVTWKKPDTGKEK